MVRKGLVVALAIAFAGHAFAQEADETVDEDLEDLDDLEDAAPVDDAEAAEDGSYDGGDDLLSDEDDEAAAPADGSAPASDAPASRDEIYSPPEEAAEAGHLPEGMDTEAMTEEYEGIPGEAEEGIYDGERPPKGGTPVSEIYEEAMDDDESFGDIGFAELDVVKRVIPQYPDELGVLYGEQAIRCEGIAFVDRNGAPIRVAVTDCADGFHMATVNAVHKWRWNRPDRVETGGTPVKFRTGFERKNRTFYPGVTYFRRPEQVTANPNKELLLKQGKMPRYPRQVNSGDDVCLLEFTVDANGNTRGVIIDECAKPFRKQAAKVVKGWKWTWRTEPDRKATKTVLVEMVFRI